ncbi:(3R)-3-hydroxyacyl-CoA dehydrogenase-like [Amblyomma americanum]
MALSGRLAIVTGAASGIGEAVCHALAVQGATVIVADIQFEAAQKVAKSLPGGANHQAMHVDVGDASSVEQLFNSVRDVSQLPLSIVVNSAGIIRSASLIDGTDEMFDTIIRVNLKGTFLMTRASARYMLRSGEVRPEGGAAIVNVASIMGKSGRAGFGIYAASKAAVVAFTKTAAQELAVHGIRCNAVLPSWTDTPMNDCLPEDQKTAVCSRTPLKRSAQPQEIAEAIKLLCLPTASSYITGAAMEVTGGLEM